MKLQLQHRSIRVRLDRAEFTSLLRGHTLQLDVRHGADALFAMEISGGPGLDLVRGSQGWRLRLPLADLEAYATTLPRRDGLRYDLGDGLGIDVEVDIRGR